MRYDPIKRKLGEVFNRSLFLRRLFYHMLDLLLLRTWHIKQELRRWRALHAGKRNILDAGSGFGQYSYYLSRANKEWDITSVDVKEEQVEDCRRFFSGAGLDNVSFEVADLTEFVREGSYDLVLSVDVMEHIEEDEKVFRNFHRSLRNGGMLLISTPSDQGGSDVHEHDDVSFIDEHVRDGYGTEEIARKLTGAGFSGVETRYSYGTPGKISWRLSMKVPIQLLNRSKMFYIVLPFYYIVVFPFCLLLNWLDVSGRHKTGTGLIVRAWK